MELWSIFDFIMPNYLYDENKFITRYYRRLEEDPIIIEELKKLVNPFILRRYKKDVIKEFEILSESGVILDTIKNVKLTNINKDISNSVSIVINFEKE